MSGSKTDPPAFEDIKARFDESLAKPPMRETDPAQATIRQALGLKVH